MRISSPAFENGASIPVTYAKDGDNQSPPLSFDDIPAEAQSLLLVVDDPDAPRGLVTHWVVFNIDPQAQEVGAGDVPRGGLQGLNVHNEARYTGPRPPDKEHRYFFHLFALNKKLGFPAGATRQEVERAAEGHMIDKAELVGRFAPLPKAASAQS